MKNMNDEKKELSLKQYLQMMLVDSMNMYVNLAIKPAGFLKDEERFDLQGQAGQSMCEKKYDIADTVVERFETAIREAARRECQQENA